MLTKQEREEIAERFRNYDKAEYVTLYSGMYDGLLGEHVPKETTVKKDRMELASRILELCDTSNMAELPLDKDGEVIHVGDTLYDDEGIKIKVCGFLLREADGKILLDINANNGFVIMSANKLTHKRPVTIASVRKQLKHVLDKGEMTSWSMAKLFDIAEQLESLGDSDD